jgi:hypothetical protein
MKEPTVKGVIRSCKSLATTEVAIPMCGAYVLRYSKCLFLYNYWGMQRN